jgi:hypothetical protein
LGGKPKKLVGGAGLLTPTDTGAPDVLGNTLVLEGAPKAGFGGRLDGKVGLLAGFAPKLNDREGAEGAGSGAVTPTVPFVDFSSVGFGDPKPTNLVGNAKGALGAGAGADLGSDPC